MRTILWFPVSHDSIKLETNESRVCGLKRQLFATERSRAFLYKLFNSPSSLNTGKQMEPANTANWFINF